MSAWKSRLLGARDDWAGPGGWRRVGSLAVLLCSVGAVGYLDHTGSTVVDLKLVYFVIVLSAALILPRTIALAMAVAAAVVAGSVSGLIGTPLIVDILSRCLIYGYAALLTSNWESERRRLRKDSRVDELTGLYNLRALREQLPIWLGPAVRTQRSMAVMMLDLDGFKAVNDRMGHAFGNELLREVANVLRMSVRVGDSLFRFGGDEFVLLLSDTDGNGARLVGDRIQRSFHEMHQTEPASGASVSLTMGIAVFSRDGATPESLLKRADEALYAAKAKGQSQIVEFADISAEKAA
jgi:diguanylate cyclase (GGDEF)-like protein